MLDMGFIPDIERIAKLIPFTRQTLFFSATMPKEIQVLADQFLQNPERIEVSTRSSTALTVTQRLVAVQSKDYEKRAALRDLIKAQDELKNAIIFCNRKKDVGRSLPFAGAPRFSVGALHGDMTSARAWPCCKVSRTTRSRFWLPPTSRPEASTFLT